MALGMLRFDDARETLRTLVLDNRDPRLRLQVATVLGLMADRDATRLLLETLQNARTLGVVSSVAQALGLIGDRSVIPELSALATDHRATDLARGFACVAIGLIGEKTRLPWNTPLSAHTNDRTRIQALSEVLDIL